MTQLTDAWNKRKKLNAEGDKLYAEGAIAFIDAVLAIHGNVYIRWADDSRTCTVEGVTYE
jgi:hypothetical protein